jgi:hypothetical protein
MSKKSIIILIYHRHKVLYLICITSMELVYIRSLAGRLSGLGFYLKTET